MDKEETKDIEDLTLTKVEDQQSLYLAPNLYSLAFYDFFLNETESILSLIPNKDSDDENEGDDENKKFDDQEQPQIRDSNNGRDEWLKDVLSRFREDRNAKNFLRVCLVFLM